MTDEDDKKWKTLIHGQNKENGEEKILLQLIKKENNFLVKWKWENCTTNKKKIISFKNAKRFYDTIDLSGWEEVA